MEYLSGVVERITYENGESGFRVIKIKSRGFSDLVTVVGNLATVNIGSIVRLRGEWRADRRYGRQFVALDCQETMPATAAGIEKYLGSGLIKGIGPVFARRIVSRFKEETLQVLEERAEYLAEVEGIGPKRLEMIKRAWQEQKEIRNVMLFLQGHGVSPAYAVKIFKAYGNQSIDLVRANPYRLADDIWGIGFKTADKIARQLGFDQNSFERCRSGMVFVLNELSNEGHCYAGRGQLAEEAERMLEIGRPLVEATLERMIEDKTVIADEGDSIYLPPFYHSEVGTARRIREILAAESGYRGAEVGRVVEAVERDEGIRYDGLQQEAIRTAVASKLMVLTGGPGTGKTTTTQAIIKVFERLGAVVLLAAPTGRAAKRLAEATGREAKTIHRLLEYRPPEGYQRDAENPLECDVLIVDEASMIDLVLMYNLLKALPDRAVLILVGDVDQLPSVGAGNVLRDIIDSGVASVVRLDRIFRQAQGSAIITNAHRVNRGEFPRLRGGRGSDFFFIEEDDPARVVEIIRELCTRRLPEYFGVDPASDIQVLCPMQRGETGAQNLNAVLQEALNKSEVSLRHGGTVYRLGDKVMQIKNNYDKNVFNGDIGKIVEIDAEMRTLAISFDGNRVEYDATELDEVVLAYAITIHKSQGSEFKIVVAPLTTQHYVMLRRNLLYTCITRAREAMVLVGSKRAVGMAVRNNQTARRNTRLGERLEGQICGEGEK